MLSQVLRNDSLMNNAFKLLSIILLPFLIGIYLPESVSPLKTEHIKFNPERLDGPFTGGFGEQTCHSCHFDYDINMDRGSLKIEGIHDFYQPGVLIDITVSVESERLEIGGFQMTSRFEDGTQAGSFNWHGDNLIFTPSISDEVQYIQHSASGTRPTDGRSVSWRFTWKAPDQSTEPVIFNIAANAGNDDDSAFGDWIYVKELTVSPEP